MFNSRPRISTAVPYLLSIMPEYEGPAGTICEIRKGGCRVQTYAGQPMMIAMTARRVSPFPNPSALYIAGANRGNTKPAIDRRQVAAASAEHKASGNCNENTRNR